MTSPSNVPNPPDDKAIAPMSTIPAASATPAEQTAQAAADKARAESQAEQLQTPFGPIVRELQAENAVGVLLLAQLGSSPAEIMLAVRTTILDQAAGGLRPLNQYVVRLAGLVEHKIALGLFDHIALVEDHPLLHHHNAAGVRVYLTSSAADPDAVLADIEAAHFEMFGRWRELGDDLNHRVPPQELLKAGMGTLGEFPEPFATALGEVLRAYQVGFSSAPGEAKIGHCYVLAFDNSYLIARSFAVEQSPD